MNSMKQSTLEATIGGLLHDFGKVTYRMGGDRRNHSTQGYDALRNIVPDEAVLDCVRYHHADQMKEIDIPLNAPAYAVYIADNIASCADRRDTTDADDSFGGYDVTQPLTSVFGTMTGRVNQLAYPAAAFRSDTVICPRPIEQVRTQKQVFQNYLSNICIELLDSLRSVEFTEAYTGAILSLLHKACGLIPSDTAINHAQDISLYDHLKMTAAFAACINEYCIAEGITDYRKTLFNGEKKFWSRQAFLLFTADISGIQSFIYNIASKGALRSLRSRSFALEMLMEHFIDELLEGCGLSRANLIYSGGGHCYILLPNTEEVRNVCDSFGKKFNHWLMEHFGTSLYMASALQPCSANDLTNTPTDGETYEKNPYSDIYIALSRKLSQKKMRRYSADEIRFLNGMSGDAHRECAICGRSDRLIPNGNYCRMCDMFINLGNLLTREELFLAVTYKPDSGEKGIAWELPSVEGRVWLHFHTGGMEEYIASHSAIVRLYTKNRLCELHPYARNLFMGDYVYDRDDPDIAKLAEGNGIKRLSVCRADVDNLGKAFISGFEQPDAATDVEKYRFVTISRTAAFSRMMSLFFRYYVNLILSQKHYKLNIVYSGGDDLFLVGHWKDIIDASVAIRDKFAEYCSGALTLSAGVGIFPAKYPIASAARSTAGLEDCAKAFVDENGRQKNAVCLFTPAAAYTFGWKEWKNDVINRKLTQLEKFFDYRKNSADADSDLHGKAMLYKILGLLRTAGDRINIARYAYMLARLEPDRRASKEYRELYKEFSGNMYKWIISENDRRNLMMAILIYTYANRER